MDLTVKKLRELLAGMDDEATVRNEQNEDFIHTMVFPAELRLSTKKPIGTCDRTGARVYPTETEGYSAFCPELDEDLYTFEWTPFEEEK